MPASKTDDLILKLIEGTQEKTNIIIVSGIPGSGKGRTSDFIGRQLALENIKTACFKMPTVQDSLKYVSDKFIKELTSFKHLDSKGREAQVIIATLPSYNHLKKVIFELKKSEEFGRLFDIKYVISKVSARNFYMNKNRNCFQYLIENCTKGVSNAVILESGNMSQSEVNIMYRTL